MNEEIKEYIIAKRTPISSCVDLSKYFIGRHKVLPVYLTPQFEREFNSKMYQLEQLKQQLQQKDEIINKAKEQLQKGITFCENDSQYAYNICVMAINREKKVLEILDNKGE